MHELVELIPRDGVIDEMVVNLAQSLEQASSVYMVARTGAWHLEVRVDETAAMAFQDAVEHVRDSPTLLSQAWVNTFKRHPDPDAAFMTSVPHLS